MFAKKKHTILHADTKILSKELEIWNFRDKK